MTNFFVFVFLACLSPERDIKITTFYGDEYYEYGG